MKASVQFQHPPLGFKLSTHTIVLVYVGDTKGQVAVLRSMDKLHEVLGLLTDANEVVLKDQ